MKNIIIIPNAKKDADFTVTRALVKKLLSLGMTIFVDEKYSLIADGVILYNEVPVADLIIVVGGDGSVIEASVLAVSLDIPILGVNLGKVGYLSEIEPDNLDMLDMITAGKYKVCEKMLLSAEIVSESGKVVSPHLAVNDIVISHDAYLGIADFVVENSTADRVKYRADSVIVATPAGSTAYSLSAGGPIVAQSVDAIMVTPVCPHSFFNRSIVFSASEVIKVRNVCAQTLKVSVDGRTFASIEEGESCVISTSDKRVKMLTFSEESTFSTLFRKIRVLEDIK